jgi:hypothetical protein
MKKFKPFKVAINISDYDTAIKVYNSSKKIESDSLLSDIPKVINQELKEQGYE